MSGAEKTIRYSNPVIPGFYPDPSICKAGSKYYVVTSSFEYFPGVPIFESEDLVHWRQIGHVLTRKSQLPLEGVGSSQGIFAPTIRYHAGRFYVVTTNVTAGGNFLVWSDDPAGEWSEPVWLAQEGIDPSLFFDEDGRVYLTTSDPGEQAIYQSEINVNTGELLCDPRRIWDGTGGAYPEAPHLYRAGDYYYLLIAEGGTEYGHMATIARGRSPFGPFEGNPDNPILTHRSLRSPIQATGHADLVRDDDGSWWAVFLAIRPVGYPNRHHLGRETFLAPVSWPEGGWPTIGDGGRVSLSMEVSSLPAEIGEPPLRKERDDFDEGAPGFEWNFLRNPREKDWSLTERKGWLALRGSEATLNDAASPAFLGRRQQHFECEARALLEFEPAEDGEEAGLTAYMNERFHYEIALTRMEGRPFVIVRRRLGSLSRVEFARKWDGGKAVELIIRADAERYEFAYASPGGETIVAGSGEAALLATEVAGGFTGVFLGMYATGNGARCRASAYFDWFDYRIE